MQIVENTIVAFSDQLEMKEILERVLWISPDRTEVVLINIVNKNKIDFPYFRQYSEIEHLIEDGFARIIHVDPDLKLIAPDEDYLQKHKKSQEAKWEIIKDIVSKEPDIYLKEHRGQLIRDAGETSGKPLNIIYDCLKKYWFYGKSLNGLLNNYFDCGYPQHAKRINNTGKKPEDREGYLLTEVDKRKFKTAIERFHKKEGKNIKETYKHMLQTEYNEGYYREHGVMVPIVVVNNCPSERQFRYWYQHEYSEKEKYEKKYGRRKAEMNARALTGNPIEDIQGPGALFEIDSTPADVILMSNDNKTEIGRAHVYFVKDVMSRMITGMHICRNPSWEEAMVALENVATDKVEFCARYGIEIDEEDWPSRHLPKFIAADRGEMKSRNSNNLVMINVQIGNAPSGRGDLKPFIEQQFRRFNARIRELIPGAVVKQHRERGDKNPADYAVYTFEAFTKIVIYFVLEFNKSVLSENFFLTRELFEDKVELTPLGVWNWGVHKNLLHEKPRQLIRYSLLPRGEGSVTRAGIIFEKMAYTCDRAIEEGWFEAERVDGSKKIEVCYDSRNCSSIFLKLKDGSFEQCYLTAKYRDYEGLHLDDVRIMVRYKKKQMDQKKKDQFNVEAVLDSVARSMTNIETQKTKEATSGRPKSAKFKNKRFVRTLDKRVDTSKGAWTAVNTNLNKDELLSGEVVPFQKPQATKEQPINNMQLFLMSKNKEKRKERD
ncbi:Mu transposase C-terminal domain-containing protein [Brevibacillus sp. AF8]|uniref:Mu transposase C-terminal domain-containing protein n=2 Tax=Brevibacillus TaxID=55080 RepID=UPI001E5BDC4E|nr:Mu transposase C-terminal domain-containing protein [Brevibacillus sp. AF8]MCE0453034.1 Mu transposase C-terminal domain-containing protein [Brevibacillus sp. AF8]